MAIKTLSSELSVAELSVAELEAENARDREEMRRRQLQVGERLLELKARGAYRLRGSNSFRHYLERKGFGVREGREMLQMARAARMDSRVAPGIVEGRIPPRSAAALERVLTRREESTAPTRDWVHDAEVLPTEKFCDEVAAEFAKRDPTPRSRLLLRPTLEDARHWRRLWLLFSRAQKRFLAADEAFGLIVRDGLMRHDPRFQKAAKLREKAQKQGRPDRRSRHVPAPVAREVLERDDDRCVVPLCPDDVFVDNAHLYTPHAQGGDATTANLCRMCHGHNLMMERALLKVRWHPTGPIFLDALGYVIERRRDPGAPRMRFDAFVASLAGEDPPAPP